MRGACDGGYGAAGSAGWLYSERGHSLREGEGLGEWSMVHVSVQSSLITILQSREAWEGGGGATSRHSGRVFNRAVRTAAWKREGTGKG